MRTGGRPLRGAHALEDITWGCRLSWPAEGHPGTQPARARSAQGSPLCIWRNWCPSRHHTGHPWAVPPGGLTGQLSQMPSLTAAPVAALPQGDAAAAAAGDSEVLAGAARSARMLVDHEGPPRGRSLLWRTMLQHGFRGCRRHPPQQGLQLQLPLVVVFMAVVLL